MQHGAREGQSEQPPQSRQPSGRSSQAKRQCMRENVKERMFPDGYLAALREEWPD